MLFKHTSRMQDRPSTGQKLKQYLLSVSLTQRLSRSIQQRLRDRRARRRRVRELNERLQTRHYYDTRLRDTLACPDNQYIPRHPDAGRIVNDSLVMHNGLLVAPGSYYGYQYQRVLQANKGVHEPQEERVFQEVLPYLPPDAVMLELGSYWAFYSMWFARNHPDRRTYLVEPDSQGLNMGRLNYLLNGLRGTFIPGRLANRYRPRPFDVPDLSVDYLCRHHNLQHLDLLHSDIQGAEREMLRGAQGMLSRRAIDYLFISTHSHGLHHACLELLQAADYRLIASHEVHESYSMDGLLVARRQELPGLDFCPVSRANGPGSPPPTG